jgi:hypothetical protein
MRPSLWVWTILVSCLIVVAGCKLDRSAEQIAELRKSGMAFEARQRAKELLEKKANRLELWRELGYCDVTVARSQVDSGSVNPASCMIEVLLLCVATGKDTAHPASKEWQSLYALTGSVAVPTVLELLDHIVYGMVRNEETAPLMFPDEEEPLDASKYSRRYTVSQTKLADMDLLPVTIRRAAAILCLLRQMPWRSDALIANSALLEQRLQKLPSVYGNVTQEFVERIRKDTEAAVARNLAQAVQEIQESGHVQAGSVFHNTILN